MRVVNEQELKDILDKHEKWLRSEEGGERANLSSANGFKFKPLQLVNTKFFVTIFDDHVQWGCRKFTFEEVKAFKFSDCRETWDESEFELNKKIITEMIQYYKRDP